MLADKKMMQDTMLEKCTCVEDNDQIARLKDCWRVLALRLLEKLSNECLEENGLKAMEPREIVELSDVDSGMAAIWMSVQLPDEGLATNVPGSTDCMWKDAHQWELLDGEGEDF